MLSRRYYELKLKNYVKKLKADQSTKTWILKIICLSCISTFYDMSYRKKWRMMTFQFLSRPQKSVEVDVRAR